MKSRIHLLAALLALALILFLPLCSRDLRTWEDWSDRVSFPDDARHGTVLAVSPRILAHLLEHNAN